MINALKQWKWNPVGDDQTAPLAGVISGELAGTTYEMALANGLQEPRVGRQLRRLADNVAQDFPPITGGTLLLAGVGTSSHTADVAAQLGRHFTTTQQGDVILVDADATSRVLTQRFAATKERGLAEAIQDALPAARFALNTAIPRLRLLPFGDRRFGAALCFERGGFRYHRRTWSSISVRCGGGRRRSDSADLSLEPLLRWHLPGRANGAGRQADDGAVCPTADRRRISNARLHRHGHPTRRKCGVTALPAPPPRPLECLAGPFSRAH